MDVADSNPAQLGGANPGDVGELAHHVVTPSDHGLAGLGQRFPPASEEFAYRSVRRWDPKPVVATMLRPVERVDR